VPCAHCHLPLPARRGGRFCCSGCYVAHELSLRDPDSRTDRLLARVVLSAFLAMGVMVFSLSLYGQLLADEPATDEAARALAGIFRLGALALSTPVLLLLGAPLLDAVWGLRRWLSADALVLLGAASAWAVSTWNTFRGGGEVYFDTATMVLVLFGLGRWLDTRARERASSALRAAIPELERPALLVERDGEREVDPSELRVGDRVRVRAGEVVPVDGPVVSGRSFVDTAALTGEEQPRSVTAGERVLAGSRAVDGTLVVRAEEVGGGRLRDAVERLLEGAMAQRSPHVRLADRLASVLLPLALAVAAVTAAVRWRTDGPEQALLDALSVILIACPCALGIATPLAFWAALGAAWRRGVLVHGGEVLERLARARTALFDKTGTLTSGELELQRLEPIGAASAGEVLRVAASLERGSEHPIARAVRRAARAQSSLRPLAEPEGFRTLPGIGVEARVEGATWTLRRAPLRSGSSAEDARTSVLLEREGTPAARLSFCARPRPEAAATLEGLRARGLAVRVLTGDGARAGAALARELGVPVEAELGPDDKVERVRAAGKGTLMVGDGLNDAAALAAADVGVSMAGGSPRSLDAADVNLLRDGLDELPGLVDRARSALLAARVNLAWAAGYNVIGVALAASGRLTPIFAALAMVLSSAAVVLNTGRLVRGQGGREREAARAQLQPESAESSPQPA